MMSTITMSVKLQAELQCYISSFQLGPANAYGCYLAPCRGLLNSELMRRQACIALGSSSAVEAVEMERRQRSSVKAR